MKQQRDELDGPEKGVCVPPLGETLDLFRLPQYNEWKKANGDIRCQDEATTGHDTVDTDCLTPLKNNRTTSDNIEYDDEDEVPDCQSASTGSELSYPRNAATGRDPVDTDNFSSKNYCTSSSNIDYDYEDEVSDCNSASSDGSNPRNILEEIMGATSWACNVNKMIGACSYENISENVDYFLSGKGCYEFQCDTAEFICGNGCVDITDNDCYDKYGGKGCYDMNRRSCHDLNQCDSRDNYESFSEVVSKKSSRAEQLSRRNLTQTRML